ncbi:substrate-binding domain-containing protein [Aeromonas caviae]|uniref:substrate-binding domain-containing protein n=1 Tax=Aeromonas caviae TaxID=648 RepID=UPI000DD0000B|nr:substrate-binding domain-containing protein [Aeromonas caviae]GKR03937.1 transcriptional regulator [Aeromonas caviae]GKR12422.1 transcriptional regulator [Aeromonas caviae]GKR16662.1 transcriptional regulator [Aeromonas caviae]GKR20957.1 transcriptional regulator [Aeromonas caviae]GKR25354.1 transcriptional regulator [Aeromonas caviae]
MTTLKSLAQHLNLSQATVSRALNGFPEVGDKTRKRVLLAAANLGYKPNLSARKLATGRSGMIGIVLGSPDELINAPTYVEELANISHLLGDYDYDFLINFARKGKELESFKRFVSSQTIDGLIIKAPEVDDLRVSYLLENNFPFVVHGRTISNPDYAYFDINNEDVLIQSVDFLAEHGHKSIAFINAPAHMAFAVQRRQGFVKAMASRNLEYPESYIQNALMIEEDGYKAGMTLLGKNSSTAIPTAIICASISQAYGLYHAARELGINIGNDLSVIAHDDVIAHLKPEHFDPPLTVTRSPFIDACKPLTDKIMALLSGTDARDLQTIVPVELIVRKSTTRIR